MLIDYGDGRVERHCVSFSEASITGAELLTRSGAAVLIGQASLGTSVCKIGDIGCDAGQACFCQCQGVTCHYWTYFVWKDGAWVYSPVGGGQRTVVNGDADAWLWSDGKSLPAEPPTGVCPALVAAPAESPTAAPTAAPAATETATPALVAADTPTATPAAAVPTNTPAAVAPSSTPALVATAPATAATPAPSATPTQSAMPTVSNATTLPAASPTATTAAVAPTATAVPTATVAPPSPSPTATPMPAASGPGLGTIAGWAALGLVAVAIVVALLRRR